MLKSDQNGIEMQVHAESEVLEEVLKSDQNGIEIQGMRKYIYDRRVKIRPKWD